MDREKGGQSRLGEAIESAANKKLGMEGLGSERASGKSECN